LTKVKCLTAVTHFPAIEVSETEESYLMCNLTAEINNVDLKYLGNEFEVRMVLNNMISAHHKNSFSYEIMSEKKIIRSYDTFELPPGRNKSNLNFS
jgi:uncharacterized pyridoxamine 5'-phosphate oxidase family protein